MNCSEFISAWKEFDETKIQTETELLSIYDSNANWTSFIIGPKTSSFNSGSPLGDFLKIRNQLDYRKEDGLIDLTLAYNESFENINTLEYPSDKPRNSFSLSGVYYPKNYQILIEHENDITKCWEEMAKLTYFRSRLKVLVTYNWDIDHRHDYRYVNEILVENFRTIINSSTVNLKEDLMTEYLLIIGQRDQERRLNWDYFEIK